MTGPIIAHPQIHPTGSESSWSLGNVFSRHIPVFLHTIINVIDCSEALSRRNLPHEPSYLAGLSHFYFFRNIFEFLVVITQTISRCRNVCLKWFHHGIYIFRCQRTIQLFSHFRHRFLDAERCLSRDLLSQYFTPIRDCSVHTEPIDWTDGAK